MFIWVGENIWNKDCEEAGGNFCKVKEMLYMFG
jgi:hypothetical protein